MQRVSYLANVAVLACLSFGFTAHAGTGSSPTGVWFDHTGRGAVEIRECGPGLCGRIVWVKDAVPGKVCGLEILGDVERVATGLWDRGWILDPEYGDRFDVEIKRLDADQLQVTGYMGIKALSETMIWRRAPADLSTC